MVFIGLDAAAGVCVLLSIYCAWRSEPASIFGTLVWCFAFATSATAANPGPPRRRFFPLMSRAAPARWRP